MPPDAHAPEPPTGEPQLSQPVLGQVEAGEVEVRLFAAARDAAGRATVRVPAGGLPQVLAEVLARSDPGLASVLPQCSLLAAGSRLDALHDSVAAGETIDVLPPFAGG